MTTKLLTQDEYSIARGLFHLAQMHIADGVSFQKALAKHLGVAEEEYDMGHIGDAIFTADHLSFEESMKREGFECEVGNG